MLEQELGKIDDFQQAALVDTLEHVATLEKQNVHLKQSVLLALQTLKSKTGGDLTLKPDAHMPPDGYYTASAELHPEPCFSLPKSPPFLPENATTVLIRNMPPRSTIDELLKAFPPDGSYDLINLPFNIKARRTSSFATINFVRVDLAKAFCERFDGQRLPHSTRSCKNALRIGPAKIQGLEANLTFLCADGGVSELRNPALLPRLYLCGATAERLVSMAPHCIVEPDEPGQPHRLDFRVVTSMLNTVEA
jgi:hypothetical protein